MVLAAKIFEVKETTDLGVILWKLKDFHEEKLHNFDDKDDVNLVTEILDLDSDGSSITGVFSRDFVRKRLYRRELLDTTVTEEAPFSIVPSKGRTFLIVLAPSVARGVKKLLTNSVANELSKAIFIGTQAIVESEMPHVALRELHESNPQATKLIWFDQVDIPGVQKLCLAGSDLVNTDLYQTYLNHGKIWYVVFEVQDRGIVIGITRSCVVTLFSKGTVEEFVDYLVEDLLSLIS